ncbi:MAG: ribonuclease III [Firmicutes bacterium]|nr:ribonuclease III [Bacillota bacterium]
MSSSEDRYFRENPSVLAFIGDAVYEVYIRKLVYGRGILSPDRMNTEAVRYVRAEAQAAAYDALFPELSEREQSVARRAKNHRITSMPGNVDFMTYKKATAFEALIGYLDLIGAEERMEEILEKTAGIIDTTKIRTDRRD